MCQSMFEFYVNTSIDQNVISATQLSGEYDVLNARGQYIE